MAREMNCPECGGHGIVYYDCNVCNGTGEGIREGTTCQICHGRGGGYLYCHICGGSGYVPEEKIEEEV